MSELTGTVLGSQIRSDSKVATGPSSREIEIVQVLVFGSNVSILDGKLDVAQVGIQAS